MYGKRHEHGTRRVSRQAQGWYDAIAEANIARVEAEWGPVPATPALEAWRTEADLDAQREEAGRWEEEVSHAKNTL